MSDEQKSVYEAISSERAIIGAILSGQVEFRDVDLSQSDFRDLICSEVYKTMALLDAQGKPCDLVTVSDAEPNLDAAVLVEFMQSGLSWEVPRYVQNVRSASMRRALSQTAQNLQRLAGDASIDPTQAADKIRCEIDELAKNGPVQEVTPIDQVCLNMHLWMFEEDKTEDSVKTGICTLDELLGGGIRGSKLCVIGARPSVGKSALGLFIAENAAAAGKNVLIVSMEMDESEIFSRILARYAQIPVDMIEARRFTDAQIDRVIGTYDDICRMHLSITTKATTPAQVRTIALKHRRENGLDLIVIDYIQLMSSGQKTSNRTEEVGQISRQLKLLAMELGIPVIAMTQMNRQSENGTAEGGRMPKISESRESGSIEQDANQFMILHPANKESLSEKWRPLHDTCQARGWTFMLIAVAKNRNGRKGIVPVAFDGAYMTFVPFDTRKNTGG